VLAAAPEWLNDNVTVFAAVALGAVALLVMRTVQRIAVRIGLLVALLVAGGFVVIERDDLGECGRLCRCELAGVEVDVPFCTEDRFPGI
jgi:hypothetical protein